MSYNYTSDTKLSEVTEEMRQAEEVSKVQVGRKEEDGEVYFVFVVATGSEALGYVASVEIHTQEGDGEICPTVLDPVYCTRKEHSLDKVVQRATKVAQKFARSEGYEL